MEHVRYTDYCSDMQLLWVNTYIHTFPTHLHPVVHVGEGQHRDDAERRHHHDDHHRQEGADRGRKRHRDDAGDGDVDGLRILGEAIQQAAWGAG